MRTTSEQVQNMKTYQDYFTSLFGMICVIDVKLLCLKPYVCVLYVGCRTAVNDLVFIVDGSWSVGFSDFDTAKQWLINITSQFDISSHYTQVI